MKVTCEYCESVVDAEKNDTCPNCGAPLADSRKAKEAELREAQKKKEAYEREAREKQRKLEQERIEAERGKMILDAVTNVTGRAHSVRNSRALKAGCLIPIVVIALIIILSIAFSVVRQISGGSVDDLLSGVVSEKFSDYEETEAVPEKVEVSLGEKAVTPMYTVLCDEIKEVDSYPWTVQKGYRYVAVHLVLTNNLSEEESLNEKTDFVVNGIAQDSRFLSGYKRISSSPVTAGLSIDGYLIFEIPTNITTAQLKYGDYVTIDIKPSDIRENKSRLGVRTSSLLFIRSCLVCHTENVVSRGIVEPRKRDYKPSRYLAFSCFIVAVYPLIDSEKSGNLFLNHIVIFAQIS